MPSFSANLGFLWTDRPLADAIRAAKLAGFDAVECHWPYEQPLADVQEALSETGMTMLGLNTIRGPLNAGMAALPECIAQARTAIDEAIAYGSAIGALNVHVMAGKAEGVEAQQTFLDNLRYASEQAELKGMGILIEPLNPFDMPGYFLRDTVHALELLQQLNLDNVKLMFDCYHVGRTEGNVLDRFDACLPYIGHVQFAAVPDRGTPDHGELNYAEVFAHIDRSGWSLPLGAEYKVAGSTEETLGWLKAAGSKSC